MNSHQRWAWAQRGLSSMPKFLLVALADHANADGVCWPGTGRLAAHLEVSRRYVYDLIAVVEAAGLIHCERAKGHRTRYQLHTGAHRSSEPQFTTSPAESSEPQFTPSSEPQFTVNPSSPVNPSSKGSEPQFHKLVNPSSIEVPRNHQRTTKKSTRRVPRRGRARDLDPDFDTFWQAYPRHVAKADALRAWRALTLTPEEVDAVLAALAQQRAWPQWTKDGGTFIPYPATWLRQRRWTDEPPAVVGPAGRGRTPTTWSVDVCQRERQHRPICFDQDECDAKERALQEG